MEKELKFEIKVAGYINYDINRRRKHTCNDVEIEQIFVNSKNTSFIAFPHGAENKLRDAIATMVENTITD